jgi:hypothetical protein
MLRCDAHRRVVDLRERWNHCIAPQRRIVRQVLVDVERHLAGRHSISLP